MFCRIKSCPGGARLLPRLQAHGSPLFKLRSAERQARPGAGPRAVSGASRLEAVEEVVTRWEHHDGFQDRLAYALVPYSDLPVSLLRGAARESWPAHGPRGTENGPLTDRIRAAQSYAVTCDPGSK